jgi:hypothetical protein
MASSLELTDLSPKAEENEQLVHELVGEGSPDGPEPPRRCVALVSVKLAIAGFAHGRSTKIAAAVVVALLVVTFLIAFGSFLYTRPTGQKGIILFIGDGFGPASALPRGR